MKKPSPLRLGKENYGSMKAEEAFQEALEEFFKTEADDHILETIKGEEEDT